MGGDTPYFVSVEQALNIANKYKLSPKSETVSIDQSHNRLLANEIISPINDPPFDNSAMDGWAVRFQDTIGASKEQPITLKILPTIQAGENNNLSAVNPGSAAKIMTGAPIPPGADSIIQVEQTETDTQSTKVSLFSESKQNFIRLKGENISKGQMIFPAGTLLTPERIGLCATMGLSELEVQTKLKIAIISTGDEIVPVGQPLQPGQIYESNSHGLAALIQWLGHTPILYPNIADNITEVREALNTASSEADIILTSGGVSMGDFDLIRKIMEEEGKIHFWRAKLRPGSPPLFGEWNKTPIWGLPGNPVSSHVVFRILVAPWIREQTMTTEPSEAKVRVKLANSVKVMPDGLTLRRISIEHTEEGLVGRTITHQGSGNLHSLATASALTLLYPGTSGEEGEWVDALLL
tara:strand:- start:69 stop:1295 length:1227 start_codon:yes stop_codon:yes gene_type:complete